VNKGGATATDVKQLMERVQRAVWEKHQISLEPEVRLIGEW
jgi:UDP-N-acetylmuramate dehydrogenase